MSGKATHKTKVTRKVSSAGQLLFRYRGSDSIAGVSRKTASRLAKTLGLTETQAIHLALARLAREALPRYEADGAPLTEQQLQAIMRLEPQGQLVTSETLFS